MGESSFLFPYHRTQMRPKCKTKRRRRKTCGALYLDNQAMNGVVAAATPASPQTPRREVAAGARRMPWITASPSRQATAAAIAAITSAGMPASTARAGAALGAGAAGLAGAVAAA